MPLRAILLDIDGTLLDSNDAHAESWALAFAEFGYDVPVERIRPLIGMGGDKLLPAAAGIEQESEEGKRLGERAGELFRTHFLPSLRPLPGARALLERLRDDGLTLIVATSAQDEQLRGLLKQAGIHDLIDDSATASDAERSKPDPDIVHAAIERSGAAPDEVLMIGDTPYDVEAATRAKIGIIALRSGGWADDDLAGALAIYDDPSDLLARYEESPIGRRLAEVSS